MILSSIQLYFSFFRDIFCPGNVNIESSERWGKDEHPIYHSSDAEGSSWVDTFVQEMMKASDWDDVRARITKVLAAFESNIVKHLVTPDQVILQKI